jgi:hypothetical protein
MTIKIIIKPPTLHGVYLSWESSTPSPSNSLHTAEKFNRLLVIYTIHKVQKSNEFGTTCSINGKI